MKLRRMTWEDAMWMYGNDKPDIRFGMKIANLKSPLKKNGSQLGMAPLSQMPDFGYSTTPKR